jgi:hypothetical protein
MAECVNKFKTKGSTYYFPTQEKYFWELDCKKEAIKEVNFGTKLKTK